MIHKFENVYLKDIDIATFNNSSDKTILAKGLHPCGIMIARQLRDSKQHVIKDILIVYEMSQMASGGISLPVFMDQLKWWNSV